MTTPDLALIGAVFLLAGALKGIVGLGLPTVAIGLLGLIMPPVEAAAMMLVPSLVTNLWQLFSGPSLGPLVRRLAPMMLGIAGGAMVGAGLIADAEAGTAALGLGAALALYGSLGLIRFEPQVPRPAERWLGPIAGAATGVVTGATGVFVIPSVPYLNGLGLSRDELVQALGLSFAVSTLALGAGLAAHGAFAWESAGVSAAALAPALAGMAIGGWLRNRVPSEAFRLGFYVALLGLAAELVARGLS